MTTAELQAQIAKLQAENKRLAEAAAAKVKPLSLKVSEKGAVSIYGLNARFPLTIYANQAERLNAFWPEVMAFIKANDSKLSRK